MLKDQKHAAEWHGSLPIHDPKGHMKKWLVGPENATAEEGKKKLSEKVSGWMRSNQPSEADFCALHVRSLNTCAYPVLNKVKEAEVLLQQLAENIASQNGELPPCTQEMSDFADTWDVTLKGE
jgi:hypothetical protein